MSVTASAQALLQHEASGHDVADRPRGACAADSGRGSHRGNGIVGGADDQSYPSASRRLAAGPSLHVGRIVIDR